ncbi:uncharacterized protein PHALS_14764 [Plasmopara halstedii]|uniref:Uncharacterized protein n=1 Tax=Plasmopara halstedii TaxID=4781 RepID=A0A0P1ARJ2_PLAHL|nr:uncharacterized protein PHALS_14764 [Plasmopara halstedii]CEG43991.1 hypothetical protein PHALS_14764 [Plasmopara halstedii]|eukprot:XP_024580360.1 hypothetical protein PHALS_14764 [Plasmopara halstedii]
MLSRRLSNVAKHAVNVLTKTKAANSKQDSALMSAEETTNDPCSHFAAFKNIEDYLNVTLIQYVKREEDGDDCNK